MQPPQDLRAAAGGIPPRARHAPETHADTPGTARLGRLGLLLAAAVCLVALVRVADVSAAQVASPYDLMYESPNLATLRLIRAGGSPYDPEVYAGTPFTLTPYTPLYFYLLAPLPEAPGEPFRVARLASLAAIAACALMLVLAARRAAADVAPGDTGPGKAPGRGAWTAALFAVGAFLLAWPITMYAAYLRMDPLGIALSAGCVLALTRATPRRVELAAVLAVLAVMTKQTYAAAGLTGVIFLLARDRALAARFVAVACGTGLAFAACATALWGRGFWFSIFVLRSSPVRWDIFRAQAEPQLQAPLFVLLLLAAAVTVVVALRRHGVGAFGRTPALAWLMCSTAVLLGTLGKEGSSSLYFMELALALPLWLTSSTVAGLAGPRVRAAFLVLVAGCVAVELARSDRQRAFYAFAPNSAERDGGFYAGVRAGLRRAGHEAPLVLNLGPPRFAYGIADAVCMNDLSTYDQAFEQGALDSRPLEAAIRARAYDIVLLTHYATPENMAGRPSRAAIEAVRETYRLLWKDAVYSYYGR